MSERRASYDHPIRIAEGVWWIGYCDEASGLHCNPYLIVSGEEAVVVDCGSRPDFPIVMSKILQTGTDPAAIRALIVQHYDPDLCGGLPNMEDVIGNPDLMILTSGYNHAFISHYNVRSRLVAVEDMDWRFRFGDGRELSFTLTPYCHSQGSICTLDHGTGTLFTSDLFGTFGADWELFLDLLPECVGCNDLTDCPNGKAECVLESMAGFHRAIMTSTAALRFALRRLSALDFRVIAPQHGSVVRRPADIARVFDLLSQLEGVGIDGVLAKEAG